MTHFRVVEAKDKAKAEKTAKFLAKQAAKQKTAQPAAQSAPKKEKEPAVELPPFEDHTPAGEKKVLRPFDDPHFSAYSPKAVESAWCKSPTPP